MRFTRLFGVACLLGLQAAWAQSGLQLPEVPADHNFTQDYARLLAPSARARIGDVQRRAFEDHDTPIMVVTVSSMAQYGAAGYSIERFAYEWFNNWQIGKRGRSGELINRGMLLLVSYGDRKARIELGADWGRRWDAQAARVMDGSIVPHFKRGDFSAGVVEGVTALGEMARKGPDGASFQDKVAGMLGGGGGGDLMNPLPKWAAIAMFAVGLVLVIASFAAGPNNSRTLLLVGAGLMVAAFLLWVILLALFLLFGRSSGGGGYSNKGGFSTGGFSGGGGASGSW